MSLSRENELIPSARRLVRSLRDMGYDFPAAVADLIDNSIAARATFVAIDVEFDGDDSWVRIADNGRGMTTSELREAMRYGADRDYDKADLGKFGLGLKTASLSQCQKLTVASRSNPDRADVAAFTWDMEHINATNRWEILPVDRGGLGPAIRSPLKDSTGTVVLWQQLDRVLGYQHPYGESARKRISTMCRELEAHLAMVFHRFLSGEIRGRKLKILVNGNTVESWDPFARSETKTKALTPVTIEVEHEGKKGQITLEPFVLPHQSEFSTADAHRRATGPQNWNQQQGFYIYRAGRMIQSGGWCRLRTSDEHTKLARIAVNFLPVIDEAFKINVAKMRVQLPMSVREAVEQAIRPVIKIAQETYRKKADDLGSKPKAANSPASTSTTPVPPSLPNITSDGTSTHTRPSIQPTEKTPDSSMDSQVWSIDALQRELEQIATKDEKPVISGLFARYRQLQKPGGKR